MKKIRYIKQLDAMDCGPSCLGMITEYYGLHPSREDLRERCSLGREGVSLLGISKAAEEIGFRTLGGRISFSTLVSEELLLPLIAHWDQSHFVVVYQIKKDRKGQYTINVADPARGLVSYNQNEFCEHWISTKNHGEEKGIILLLEPTEKLYQLAKKRDDISYRASQIGFLWSYFVRYKRFFLQLILGLFIGAVLQLIFPFLTQALVDTGIRGRDIDFVWLILIGQSMLLLSRTAVELIQTKLLLHISTRINISLLSDFFIKLMRLPMKFFDVKLMGDLLQRIDDHKRVETFLTSSSLSIIFSSFTFIVFSIVLANYSLLICSIFLIGTLLYTAWITLFLKRRKALDYRYFEQSSRNNGITYQLIQGMQEIKLQGCEQRKRWEWEDTQASLFKVTMDTLNLQQMQQIGCLTINELKNIIITIIAATSVIQGNMSLGMMLAVQYIIGQLNAPVEQLIRFIHSWQDVRISLERMNEIHSEKNEILEKGIKLFHPQNNGERFSLTIEGMSFRYNIHSDMDILSEINLKIPEGKVTAIVGASGSGKTTLLKLLLGFYKPIKGSIKVGGTPLDNLDIEWWRGQCGAVMQEGYLFSDTIARNIAISDDEPNIEKIRSASRIANIANYIEDLPLSYNTLIGNDGQGISQGQRQRILIARMIYKNPMFVFLDEATNALDANNERLITENLSDFYKGKTVVVVAHRLSTVRNADQIIVLEDGKVAEVGTHDELVVKREKYFTLVKNQLELGN